MGTYSTLNFHNDGVNINLEPPRINNMSNVILDKSDIQAANGAIHVVEEVLTPPSISNNIMDILKSDSNFTTFVAAVKAVGLNKLFNGDGPLTVFAPTNDAFVYALDSLPNATLEEVLLLENLDSILERHVLTTQYLSTSLESGDLETLSGTIYLEKKADDQVELSYGTDVSGPSAHVDAFNRIASNGIVHVVDNVLIPPDPEPTDELDEGTNSPVQSPNGGTNMPPSQSEEPSGAALFGTTSFVAFIAVVAIMV